MKIISWNVNSVRARLENIQNYIKDTKPDLLFLQEIKTQEENFPKEAFDKIGFNSFIFGQKSYNGVAFLCNKEILNIEKGFIKDKLKQSRIISGDIKLNNKNIKIINIYVPNGNPVDTEKYEYKKIGWNYLIKKLRKN